MSAFTPTNKPKPILEFHKIGSDRASSSQPIQPPRDLRWLRVEEFFLAKTMVSNTKKAYERELRRFVGWTDKAWNDITGRDVANYKHYLETCATDSGKPQRSQSSVAVTMTALKSNFCVDGC